MEVVVTCGVNQEKGCKKYAGWIVLSLLCSCATCVCACTRSGLTALCRRGSGQCPELPSSSYRRMRTSPDPVGMGSSVWWC